MSDFDFVASQWGATKITPDHAIKMMADAAEHSGSAVVHIYGREWVRVAAPGGTDYISPPYYLVLTGRAGKMYTTVLPDTTLPELLSLSRKFNFYELLGRMEELN